MKTNKPWDKQKKNTNKINKYRKNNYDETGIKLK